MLNYMSTRRFFLVVAFAGLVSGCVGEAKKLSPSSVSFLPGVTYAVAELGPGDGEPWPRPQHFCPVAADGTYSVGAGYPGEAQCNPSLDKYFRIETQIGGIMTDGIVTMEDGSRVMISRWTRPEVVGPHVNALTWGPGRNRSVRTGEVLVVDVQPGQIHLLGRVNSGRIEPGRTDALEDALKRSVPNFPSDRVARGKVSYRTTACEKLAHNQFSCRVKP